MASKKNSTPQRLDSDFEKDLNEALMFRVKSGLTTKRKEITFPEITSLARRTESWKGVLFELKTKPKKK